MKTAIYVHVPFCLQRCRYCDFNTYSGLLSLREAYVDAVRQELQQQAAAFPEAEARTLYFGGGTPSLLSPEMVGAVIRDVRKKNTVPSELNYAIDRVFREHNVCIAFPQMDVHLNYLPPKPDTGPGDEQNPQ